MEWLSAFGCIGGADSVDEESARPCAPGEFRRRFSRPPADGDAPQFDADGLPVARPRLSVLCSCWSSAASTPGVT